MAVTLNPFTIMTSDFYQENYSDDLSLSSREIEEVLKRMKKAHPENKELFDELIETNREMSNLLDSMTGKEAHELLCQILED